jgi:hypothetical protein
MFDSTIIAAAISGIIALIGVIASLAVARQQSALQDKELALKAKEIENLTQRFEAEFESLRQTQLTEVLRKRIDTYPKLWKVLITYTTNWGIAQNPRNLEWVKSFLAALNECNVETGIFFSERVYKKFFDLRAALIKLEQKMSTGQALDEQDFWLPDRICLGSDGEAGLSTYLKDDLGSYGNTAIQATNR